jgi:hypothetical protein
MIGWFIGGLDILIGWVCLDGSWLVGCFIFCLAGVGLIGGKLGWLVVEGGWLVGWHMG